MIVIFISNGVSYFLCTHIKFVDNQLVLKSKLRQKGLDGWLSRYDFLSIGL